MDLASHTSVANTHVRANSMAGKRAIRTTVNIGLCREWISITDYGVGNRTTSINTLHSIITRYCATTDWWATKHDVQQKLKHWCDH